MCSVGIIRPLPTTLSNGVARKLLAKLEGGRGFKDAGSQDDYQARMEEFGVVSSHQDREWKE